MEKVDKSKGIKDCICEKCEKNATIYIVTAPNEGDQNLCKECAEKYLNYGDKH